MVTNKHRIIYLKSVSSAVLLALGILTAINSQAATVWTGPNINYTKSASTPADTIVAGKVVLQRGSSEVLFNTAAGETFGGLSSPADTEWAFGTINNFASLTYQSMGSLRTTAGGDLSAKLLNQNMVVHLINEDIYFSIKFTTWGRFGSGTVAYTRSTAGAVTPPSPTVSITSPANAAVFTAPADVAISANATVSSGTVTNVSFFEGTTLLGSVEAAPFNFTATGLQAGSYSLTAVAKAAGISSTSAVVAITVNTPTLPSPTVSITSPTNGAVFTAPADVVISADATVSSGTVTNVSCFNGRTLLGSVQAPPFNFTATGLQAGSYSLTAVATAAGISSTSTVVAVSVIASSTSIQLTVPGVSNGFVSFTYSADQGASYIVAGSFDLFNWQPLATNVASGSSVVFTEAVGANSSRFYRVGRVSGP
jgi:hypothetical protein